MTKRPRIGIQLYTVRDLTGDDIFKDTLRQLADIGFEGVEFAWKYGGMMPGELRDFLESVNLQCCGMHVQLDELLDTDNEVYAYAAAVGCEYMTTSHSNRLDDWDALAVDIERAGRAAASKGMVFTYHNHHPEFETVGDRYAEDVLLESTDPQFVKAELDLGWVKKGGADPMAYWCKYGGRIPQIHLRDYDSQKEEVVNITDGFIDLKQVQAQALELDTDWIIYEQDAYPVSAMDSCCACIESIRAAGML